MLNKTPPQNKVLYRDRMTITEATFELRAEIVEKTSGAKRGERFIVFRVWRDGQATARILSFSEKESQWALKCLFEFERVVSEGKRDES